MRNVVEGFIYKLFGGICFVQFALRIQLKLLTRNYSLALSLSIYICKLEN